jgi:hypothetical protein
MKVFWHTTNSSLLKSWPPGIGWDHNMRNIGSPIVCDVIWFLSKELCVFYPRALDFSSISLHTMLSNIFHLNKTYGVKVSPRNSWKIDYNSKNCTLHKIWLKLCNCVHSNLKKKGLKTVFYKIIKNYSKNNENPLIMSLVKYSMKTELLPLDSIS